MSETIKQAVTGFKVVSFNVKKSKEGETIKLLLEGSVEGIGAADCDMGKILNALQHHMSGDTEVGLSVFIQKE